MTAAIKRNLDSAIEVLRTLLDEGHDTWSARFGGRNFTDSIKAVIGPITDDLQRSGSIDESSLLMITDLAWSAVSSFSSVHPGWNDLLLYLSNADSDPPPGLPRFRRMGEVNDHIRNRYQSASPQGPGELHLSVARLLQRQASTANRKRGATAEPHPVAYSTSFDIELERALLEIESELCVVFPVLIFCEGNADQIAAARWCIATGVKTLSEQEGGVTREVLVAEDIMLATQKRVDQMRTGGLKPPGTPSATSGEIVPIVVRLTGCPLLDIARSGRDRDPINLRVWSEFETLLSDPQSELLTDLGKPQILMARSDDAGPDEQEPIFNLLNIEHSVIVTEFDATVHNAIDRMGNTDDADARALPDSLVLGTASKGKRTRLWAFLGVQLADSAIRQRIVQVVTWKPRQATVNGSVPDWKTFDDAAGVAISTSISQSELDLLNWMMFDWIRGDINNTVQSIDDFQPEEN